MQYFTYQGCGLLTSAPKIDEEKAFFTIAINEYGKMKSVSYFPVICFNKKFFKRLACLNAGDPVLVDGHIKPNEYIKNGIKYSSYDFIVQNIEFLRRFSKKEVQK